MKEKTRIVDLVRVPISTSKLSPGMFVGLLDRPWLETPFVFQGFEIKDKFEIEQLQSYCSQVYVEVDRSKLTEAEIRALAASGPVDARGNKKKSRMGFFAAIFKWTGLAALFAARTRKESAGYEISATVRSEAPRAKATYEKAARQFQHIFERTRRIGSVDIEVISQTVEPLIESVLRNPNAMAWTVFSGKRSDRSYSRAVATSVWSIMFGRHLGFDLNGLRELATGGLLLDIGNVTLPENIVNAEGAISEAEYEQFPQHVQAGVDILHRSKGIEPAVFDMVSYHHERYDGTGYPHEFQGSNIPFPGRIAGIVDCYDAMTTKTSYSPALSAYDAARELNDMRDTKFQSEVVAQFLHMIGMFPTGSVVQLSNGTVGLVLEQNPANPLRPKVMLLKDATGADYDSPRIFDMQKLDDRKGADTIWIAKGHEHGAFGIDPLEYFKKR